MKTDHILLNELIYENSFKNPFNTELVDLFELESEMHNMLHGKLEFMDFPIYVVLTNVYKDIYNIEDTFKSAVSFKEYIEGISQNHIIGNIEFNFYNKNQESIKVQTYDGYYSTYIVLLYNISFYYFNKELNNKNEKIESIIRFLNDKYKIVAKNPYNYFILNASRQVFQRSNFTSYDIREYVDEILTLIKDKILNPKGIKVNILDEKNDPVFKINMAKNFFYYILQETKEEKSNAFYGYIYRYFNKKNFLTYSKPKNYIKFLSKNFGYNSNKIQDPSTYKEEDMEKVFDELYDNFRLQ